MEKLIARRVSKGFNATEFAQLLNELIAAHDGDNLEYALVYNAFATDRGAAKFVAQLAA